MGPSSPSERFSGRAAIVHDWFQGFHGSERVVDSMLDLFERTPDVFTFHAARELLPGRLAAAIKRESRVARLPGIRQRGHTPGRWRWLLPYMPWYFAHLDLREYDIVISSSHACAIGARPRPGAVHLCYCYTPMRYVWLPETDGGRTGRAGRWALERGRGALKRWDYAAAQRPGAYVAISSAVADRIRRFYGREASVVHPPVATGDLVSRTKDPRHFLWVHRLVSYKHPIEVAEAFRELEGYRLTMVGVGPLERQLRSRLPANVELHGWLERDQLSSLYAQAGGFVHVGEEDFGITMVEALAAGTPVVALDRGGARDIVEDGRTGRLIADPTDIPALRAAVLEVAATDWDRVVLQEAAERFSEASFRLGLSEELRILGAR